MARRKKSTETVEIPANVSLEFLQRRYLQLVGELQQLRRDFDGSIAERDELLERVEKFQGDGAEGVESLKNRIQELESENEELEDDKDTAEEREREAQNQLADSEEQLKALRDTVGEAIYALRKVFGREDLDESLEMFDARRALEDLELAIPRE